VQTIRRLLRRATWLSMFAMLGLALAPAGSHALAGAGPGNPWSEVCSVAGGKLVRADARGEQAGAGAHLGHCPLCGHLGHAPALPMAEADDAPNPDGADFLPTLFAQAPSPPFAWAAAQPRAPPAAC